MSTFTVALMGMAAICGLGSIICGGFAVEELAKIARRRSPEQFLAGTPQFSIWQRQDFRTYIGALRLVASTPPGVVVDRVHCRWWRGFWGLCVLTVASVGWLLARLLLS